MYSEYFSWDKVREFEREVARVRLAAAAERASAPAQRRAKPQTVPAMPMRLLRALRPAS